MLIKVLMSTFSKYFPMIFHLRKSKQLRYRDMRAYSTLFKRFLRESALKREHDPSQ